MRLIIVLGIALNGLAVSAQQISLDSSLAYVGKKITVYGKVTEAFFNYDRKRDTSTLKLLDESSGKWMLVKILPEARAGFGYRPEDALLNKMAYFSGNLEINKGEVEMYVNSPFSISFKKGGAMFEPSAPVLPPQPKIQASAKNSNAMARGNSQPASAPKQPIQAKERKIEPIIDQPKIVKKSKPIKENNTDKAEQDEKQKPAIQIEKAPEAKVVETKKIEIQEEKKVATPNPYNGPGQNPNPLSVAPVAHKDPLVGNEIILKSKINLRAGPGNFFTTIGSLGKGENIKILSCSFDWCKVLQVKDVEMRLLQGYVKSEKLK